jgi:hypothetical protein
LRWRRSLPCGAGAEVRSLAAGEGFLFRRHPGIPRVPVGGGSLVLPEAAAERITTTPRAEASSGKAAVAGKATARKAAAGKATTRKAAAGKTATAGEARRTLAHLVHGLHKQLAL